MESGRTSAANDARPPSLGRHGVLFVHGVGDQRESDVLLDIGGALLDWLGRWHRARGDAIPSVLTADLGFLPFDAGNRDRPSHAAVQLPTGETWELAEAWWALSTRAPGFATMVSWSLRYLFGVVAQLWRALAQRAGRLLAAKPNSSDPPFWARLVDLANTLGLLVLYPILAILGYAVLLPLLVAAQLPIPAVQDFVLIRLLRPFLQINAGEFRTYLDDPMQAANMHRRVAQAVAWLGERCDDVTIVAHSEGAVVAFGALADPTCRAEVRRVRKFVSLGAGLDKAWDVRPGLARLHGPIAGHVRWLDIWSSYDPVPAGCLRPPLVSGHWAPIFQPDKGVVQEQRLTPRLDPDPEGAGRAEVGAARPEVFWPVSEQVTNGMDVLSEHGGYWSNDEQVLLRLAAEVDAPCYRDSRYWRGERQLGPEEERTEELTRAIRERRERVSVLALGRDLAVLGALITAALGWADLAARGVDFWTSAAALAGQARAPAYVAVLADLVRWLGLYLPPLGGVTAPLLALPVWLLVAVALPLLWMALFDLWYTWWWTPWDRARRAVSLARVACAGAV